MSGTRTRWPLKRIGELATIARGSSPRPIADQRYFEGGDIPWIKIADATKSGKYLYATKEHVNEFGASFSRRLPIGSLIVAASGTLGYTQMLGVSGCVHDGWLYLTDFRRVDKHYLYYFFQWKKEHFYNSAYGPAIQKHQHGDFAGNRNSSAAPSGTGAHRFHPFHLRRPDREQHPAHQDSRRDGADALPGVVRQLPLPRPRQGAENQVGVGPIPDGWNIQRIEDFGAIVTGKTPSTDRPDFYGVDVPFIAHDVGGFAGECGLARTR
jgi:hypothetical protein